MQTEGQLTIGADFPVKVFVSCQCDDPKGFEADLVYAIAKELGVPQVEWMSAPFTGLFSPVAKDFDIAINEITITDERSGGGLQRPVLRRQPGPAGRRAGRPRR